MAIVDDCMGGVFISQASLFTIVSDLHSSIRIKWQKINKYNAWHLIKWNIGNSLRQGTKTSFYYRADAFIALVATCSTNAFVSIRSVHSFPIESLIRFLPGHRVSWLPPKNLQPSPHTGRLVEAQRKPVQYKEKPHCK